MNRRSLMFGAASAIVAPSIATALASNATPAADSNGASTLYRIPLERESLFSQQLIVGAIINSMATDTTVLYPAGGSPESLVIDYVLDGDYSATSPLDLLLFGKDDQTGNDIPAEEPVDVLTGSTLVVEENEGELQIAAGPNGAITLTLGLFTLKQASGASEVDGELTSSFLSATPPFTLAESGVTALLLEGEVVADTMPDVLVSLSIPSYEDWGPWTFFLIPAAE